LQRKCLLPGPGEVEGPPSCAPGPFSVGWLASQPANCTESHLERALEQGKRPVPPTESLVIPTPAPHYTLHPYTTLHCSVVWSLWCRGVKCNVVYAAIVPIIPTTRLRTPRSEPSILAQTLNSAFPPWRTFNLVEDDGWRRG